MVEFRKRIFSSTVERAFVYSSSPVKRIIGSFPISKIQKGSPLEIWKKYSEVGCIDKMRFDDYYQGHDIAYGIEIASFQKFCKAINPKDIDSEFRAPQSYCYIDNVEFINRLFVDRNNDVS